MIVHLVAGTVIHLSKDCSCYFEKQELIFIHLLIFNISSQERPEPLALMVKVAVPKDPALMS